MSQPILKKDTAKGREIRSGEDNNNGNDDGNSYCSRTAHWSAPYKQ